MEYRKRKRETVSFAFVIMDVKVEVIVCFQILYHEASCSTTMYIITLVTQIEGGGVTDHNLSIEGGTIVGCYQH